MTTNQNDNKNDSQDLNDHELTTPKPELTKEEKAKINKAYYEANKDRILSERKAKRKAINEKLNQALDNKSKYANVNLDLDQIPISKIDPNQYVYPQVEKYIKRNGEFDLLDKYTKKTASKGLILVGHAGTGKTFLAKTYAIENNFPIVFCTLNSEIRYTDLLGSFTLKGNDSIFSLGYIPTAIELANKHPSKTCVLVLDEINLMPPEVQSILNETLSFKQGVTIPLINKTYRLNKDSKILVIATMNYSNYQGTYPLNFPIKSRFDFKTVKNMKDKQITQLLKQFKLKAPMIQGLIALQKELMTAFEEDKLSQPTDTRELVKFAEDYNLNLANGLDEKTAMKEALELTIVGKYIEDKDQFTFVRHQIESYFDNMKVDP